MESLSDSRTLYLKLDGRPYWFEGWNGSQDVWSSTRDHAHVYRTDETMWEDFDLLKALGCKLLVVVDR